MHKIFCKLGIHFFEHIKGDFNKYYECSKCNKRKVVYGLGGYEPVDRDWLNNA